MHFHYLSHYQYFLLIDRSQWYRAAKANLKRVMKTMNFFRKESILSQIDNAELMSIKATRFYIVLLLSSVLVVVAFRSIEQTTVTETVLFPSFEIYEQFQAKYPNTFFCTCQQITTFYKSFVSTKPKIHQVRYSINLVVHDRFLKVASYYTAIFLA